MININSTDHPSVGSFPKRSNNPIKVDEKMLRQKVSVSFFLFDRRIHVNEWEVNVRNEVENIMCDEQAHVRIGFPLLCRPVHLE